MLAAETEGSAGNGGVVPFSRVRAKRQRREPPPKRPYNVFISCCTWDEKVLDELVMQMCYLEHDGLVKLHAHNLFLPGEQPRREAKRVIKVSIGAILLISGEYLQAGMNNGLLLENELPTLLSQEESRGMLVLPILIRDSPFPRLPYLYCFEPVNPRKFVGDMSPTQRSKIFAKVARQIEDVARALDNRTSGFP